MRKLIFLVTVMASHFACHSQNLFGIFAGAQATTAKYSVTDVKQPTDHKYGFSVGTCMKIPFDVNLFFSPAMFYSMKGYKVQFNHFAYPPDTNAVNNNTTIHTLEIAPLLQYDLGKSSGHCFIKGGPSVDFQLTGTESYSLKNGDNVDRNMPFGFTAYGHYSVNLLLQFGYESKNGFIVFAQYTYGLVSLNNADSGPQIFHRVLGLSIGKYLNSKKNLN